MGDVSCQCYRTITKQKEPCRPESVQVCPSVIASPANNNAVAIFLSSLSSHCSVADYLPFIPSPSSFGRRKLKLLVLEDARGLRRTVATIRDSSTQDAPVAVFEKHPDVLHHAMARRRSTSSQYDNFAFVAENLSLGLGAAT